MSFYFLMLSHTKKSIISVALALLSHRNDNRVEQKAETEADNRFAIGADI